MIWLWLLGVVWLIGFVATFIKAMHSEFIDESVWDSIRNGGGELSGFLLVAALVVAALWPISVLPGLVLRGIGNALAR